MDSDTPFLRRPFFNRLLTSGETERSTRGMSSHPASYRETEFAELDVEFEASRFFDAAYDEVLAAAIEPVVRQEAPMTEDVLVQRISRVHGLQKAGERIRERVIEIAAQKHHFRPDPVDGRFVWHDAGSASLWNAFRVPSSEDAKRAIHEICAEEVRAAARASSGKDLPVEIARLFGVTRLSAGARQRLEAVIAMHEPGSSPEG